MDWDLVKPYSRVFLGKIGVHEAYTVGHGRGVLGLQPDLVRTEYPMGETPQLGATFIKKFLEGVTSLLNFVPPAGLILLIRTGGAEWWGLF